MRVHAVDVWDGFEVRGVENGELGLVSPQASLVGSHEHVASKGAVPCVVRDHANGEGFGDLCATVQVLDEEGVACLEVIDHLGPERGEGCKVG